MRRDGSLAATQVGADVPPQPAGTVAVSAQGELEVRNVIIYDRP